MKKLLLGFISLILVGQVGFSQPVSDQAIIPMAITVNSILRLNIVSGGNIEFVFNSIDAVTNGIANSTAYDTRFTVASTTNWRLDFGTDLADFTNDAGGTINLNLVAVQINDDGTTCISGGRCSVNAAYDGTAAAWGDLVQATTNLLGNGTGNVGTTTDNAFVIHWECGTGNSTSQFIPTGAVAATPGRYTANVFLSLTAL